MRQAEVETDLMLYMKSSRVTSVSNGEYQTSETSGESPVFKDSQLFPAKDGSWLMVDWASIGDVWFWYVTEGVL